MSEVVYEEFLPRVFIYKNLLPSHKEITDHFRNLIEKNEATTICQKYTEWSVFGKNIAFNWDFIERDDKDLTQYSEKDIAEINKEKSFLEEMMNAFYVATDHYLQAQGVEKEDDWVIMKPAMSIYEPTTEENERGPGAHGPLAMDYHTDYEQLKRDMPGDKFVLTCTFYFNDDYEGGEVDFLANGESHLYKPEAGDVCVFPSGNPDYFSEGFTYYHGVGAVKGSRKFFTRTFYMKPYAGSPEWLANQEKYGEEVWAEMEKARIFAGMRQHMDKMMEINIEKPISAEDLGIDLDKECGLEEFK